MAITKRTVPRSIEGSHLLRRAKPLFSDVGMHYIQSCLLFPTTIADSSARRFVGVDLPTGIRGQGQAAGGWQQCIGSSDEEVGSGCRGFI